MECDKCKRLLTSFIEKQQAIIWFDKLNEKLCTECIKLITVKKENKPCPALLKALNDIAAIGKIKFDKMSTDELLSYYICYQIYEKRGFVKPEDIIAIIQSFRMYKPAFKPDVVKILNEWYNE